MKVYAGIGSRKTPQRVIYYINSVAQRLAELGYTLRSGGAVGADTAFQNAAEFASGKREIFYARDAIASSWCWEEVIKHIPNDRSGFETWKLFTKQLLARNMMQVLGRNGDSPVDFVLCYAPSTEYSDSSAGGTGWAIRCALAHNIKVFNLYSNKDKEEFEKYMVGRSHGNS